MIQEHRYAIILFFGALSVMEPFLHYYKAKTRPIWTYLDVLVLVCISIALNPLFGLFAAFTRQVSMQLTLNALYKRPYDYICCSGSDIDSALSMVGGKTVLFASWVAALILGVHLVR